MLYVEKYKRTSGINLKIGVYANHCFVPPCLHAHVFKHSLSDNRFVPAINKDQRQADIQKVKYGFGEHWPMSRITALPGYHFNCPVSTEQCTVYMSKNVRPSFGNSLTSEVRLNAFSKNGP
jgi:hypothetical protein